MQTPSRTLFPLAALLLATSLLAASAQAPPSPADAKVQSDVTRTLDKKQFTAVQSSVAEGVVTLTGVVPLYFDRQDAARRAARVKNVASVINRIEIATGETSDATLRQKLVGKISTDREGYGTTAFNAITVNVLNGVVTLGGVAYGPPDKTAAFDDAANTVGVRDVVDNIAVAPTSPNDDRLRQLLYRAIYGYPSFNKYAIDPVKPIRIIVINGNATLTGQVDSKVDSDTASLRANGVSGVFKVTNQLNYGAPATEK